jgi:hypothetical protein
VVEPVGDRGESDPENRGVVLKSCESIKDTQKRAQLFVIDAGP